MPGCELNVLHIKDYKRNDCQRHRKHKCHQTDDTMTNIKDIDED